MSGEVYGSARLLTKGGWSARQMRDKFLPFPFRLALLVFSLPAICSARHQPAQSPARPLALSDSKTEQLSPIPTEQIPEEAAISSDGNLLAYATKMPSGSVIRLGELKTGAEKQLLGPLSGQCVQVVFDSSGRFIFYVLKLSGSNFENAYWISLEGEGPAVVASNVGGGVAISPDGSQVAFVRAAGTYGSELIVANSDRTGERILVRSGADRG